VLLLDQQLCNEDILVTLLDDSNADIIVYIHGVAILYKITTTPMPLK